jgi:pimeloyl-ACP methyl ester carboxylesterase
MTATTTPVTFLNPDGLRLFGILHQPERPRDPGTAILLLSPGVKMRVAPHRLYLKMTARFVALGYTVLRFDFHGLGDAEGELPEGQLADLYRAVQMGRHVGDTVAAMEWMQKTHGVSRFIVSGLCGGALTGLLAAEEDPRITALVGLSIPVGLDGSNVDVVRAMTVPQLKGTRKRYFRKFRVWDPAVWRSWARFFTFQSHYRMIVHTMLKPFLARFRSAGPAVTGEPDDSTNPRFAPAFRRMVSTSRRILLVFGEGDRLRHDFNVKFMSRHAQSLERFARFFEIHVVPQANHIFSFEEWQDEMLDHCCRFLAPEIGTETGAETGAAAGAAAVAAAPGR